MVVDVGKKKQAIVSRQIWMTPIFACEEMEEKERNKKRWWRPEKFFLLSPKGLFFLFRSNDFHAMWWRLSKKNKLFFLLLPYEQEVASVFFGKKVDKVLKGEEKSKECFYR